MRIKDKPNKVKANLIVEFEDEFYNNESETLKYSANQYLKDNGFNVIGISWTFMDEKDKLNKVKAKLILEIEGEFYDDESDEETLRYCVEQDLEDAGFNVIDVSVM